uniref:Similarity. Hypothetical start n=1 Tax=Microcystis aeruginosa (strain PCC 7806) TaxID=267872 RepID=A8Y9Y6_MICA7|nr:unnamed protein product [Microcystis aeruginosa PCC 7806]
MYQFFRSPPAPSPILYKSPSALLFTLIPLLNQIYLPIIPPPYPILTPISPGITLFHYNLQLLHSQTLYFQTPPPCPGST